MYYACMANIQIRDVPETIHRELVRRAENSGKSLQQFLMGQLAIMVDKPDIDEVLRDIRELPKLPLTSAEIVKMLKEERARS
jgi:hypothetical protein